MIQLRKRAPIEEEYPANGPSFEMTLKPPEISYGATWKQKHVKARELLSKSNINHSTSVSGEL